jgi:membrane-associated PAP2 superfamily phosphatase
MNSEPAAYPRIDRSFWLNPAAWPALAFVLAFGAIQVFGLDPPIARAWSFDTLTGHWLGTGAGDWWAHRVLHDDGRWVVRAIAAAACVLWIGGYRVAAWRGLRQRAGYVALAMITAVVLVGVLKAITHVDCPWSLAGFGGHEPYVPLFASRPAYLPAARCFPGAHSASGFSLLCFYFAWRDSSPALARGGLAAGLTLGSVFAIGQEARGAHFVSHDLASAAVVWFVQLGLYAWLLRPRSAMAGAAAPRQPLACRL